MSDEWDDEGVSHGVEFNKPSYARYDNATTNGHGARDQFADSGYGSGQKEGGYGGGRSGGGFGRGQNSQEGDWNCSSCNKNNFASRSACFSCKTPKDGAGGGGGGFGNDDYDNPPPKPRAGQRAGDWTCSGCNKSNFASRAQCFSCQKEKDDTDVIATGDSGGGGGMTNGARKFGSNDWKCNDCGKTNFANRTECFSCHASKPEGASGGGGGFDGGSSDAKPRAGQRPGDWTCPSCEKSNFASRTQCFGCSEDKPAHLVSELGTDEKPREFYIPPEISNDENELFGAKINTGINFNNFSKIPVKVTGENAPPPILDFPSSGLREFLLTNVEKSGYTVPTPIQKYSIPVIMNGRDLMACAQTGSGKTAAFLLPIINALLEDNRDLNIGQPHVLIVTPTRELCIQIYEQAHKFAHKSYIKVNKLYGGTASKHQSGTLQGGTHILVATPGRLLDFVNRSYITFRDIRFVVLDEADRMLDMGFIDNIESIMKDMPQNRQTLMYSATFPEEIQALAGKYLRDYIFVTVGIVGGACTDVKQTVLEIPGRQKRDNLMDILGKINGGKPKGVLVFLETKKGADFLASYLSETQYPTTSIHSDRLQKEREMALGDFKSGRMAIMIATSVAARGLDIPNVQHVINFDMPKSIDEYVHRIGRTGRVGNEGEAITFFDPDKDSDIGSKLVKILREAGQEVPSFLEQYDMGGAYGGGGGDFGGRDIRKDVRKQPVAALEAEEEW